MSVAADIVRVETDLLRAEDDFLAINAARQKPRGQQILDTSIMQRGYESQRNHRDSLERELWRLQALQASREMEQKHG